jgi:hypothetical protein
MYRNVIHCLFHWYNNPLQVPHQVLSLAQHIDQTFSIIKKGFLISLFLYADRVCYDHEYGGLHLPQ